MYISTEYVHQVKINNNMQIIAVWLFSVKIKDKRYSVGEEFYSNYSPNQKKSNHEGPLPKPLNIKIAPLLAILEVFGL